MTSPLSNGQGADHLPEGTLLDRSPLLSRQGRHVPKAGIYGFNWFNVYYTPGVSMVSTSIRDDNDTSFDLSNRGNLVAVVSDSTRVLGDGDVTPSGGLGVMEGKAFLMKYLGGVDAVALCVNSYNKDGKHDPTRSSTS